MSSQKNSSSVSENFILYYKVRGVVPGYTPFNIGMEIILVEVFQISYWLGTNQISASIAYERADLVAFIFRRKEDAALFLLRFSDNVVYQPS